MTPALVRAVVLGLTLALPAGRAAADTQPGPVASPGKDRHVTAVGFFDMHVCNWPERPLFLKALFSSTRYEQLREIRVFAPDGQPLLRFDLTQFRTVTRPGQPAKRVYLTDMSVPPGAQDGWYAAHVVTADGRVHVAMDRIEIRRMEQATGEVSPAHEAVLAVPPRQLSWAPVAGAHHYRVFVRDRWDGDRLVYESRPLTEPRLVIPPGIVKPGGAYLWQVNTRDRNEDPVYGDFNHGSLTPAYFFSVLDPS